MKKQKVFGIGYHKTGTSTLYRALRLLGYTVCGNQTWLASHLIKGDVAKALELMESHDACEDTPWPILYKQLDAKYPGSKFILTVRDEDSWYKSVLNHFGGHSSLMREWIYGIDDPNGNEDLYKSRYNAHNKDVKLYFKDRPKDLLVINWKENAEWESLCSFLEQPIPKKSFPHSNKGAYTNSARALQKLKLFIYKNFLKPFGYGR